MDFADKAYIVFEKTGYDYDNRKDPASEEPKNPYDPALIEHTLYEKNWVDAVQWHLEDLMRDPDIDPAHGMAIKRRIDVCNQHRTDLVEAIDTYFLELFANVTPLPDATVNTESPAWALDRLSILALKISHMAFEAYRASATESHRKKCMEKLGVLVQQRDDLICSIDTLLDDIAAGIKIMKTYRQMKMYNDPDTNPVLYGRK